jgi:hypothetical protein
MGKKRCLGVLVVLTAAIIVGGCSSVVPLLEDTPTVTAMVTATSTRGPKANPTSTRTPAPSGIGGVLADGEARISSYPPGAEVYLVPAQVSVRDFDVDDVLEQENPLGTAPLTTELSPGEYYVVTVFTPGLFAAAGYDLPRVSDPTFDYAFPFDGNPTQSMSFVDGEEIERISKTYRLMKRAGNSEALISIALPLPENQRGQQKPTLYPTLATVEALRVSYTFDDSLVRPAIEDALEENNLATMIDASMVDEMIEVLLRVGKVKLDTSDIDLLIQMHGTDTNRFSITVYG